jgi:lysozyme
MNLERLKAQLIRHEGCVLHAYQDSAPEQFWTIGVGRLIDKRRGGGISEEEAAYLLENDIRKAEAFAAQYPWYAGLDEVRQAVVIDMLFNMGPGRFAGFKKMLAAISVADWKEAAVQMLDSKWATQVGNRALRLSEMMRSGVWP